MAVSSLYHRNRSARQIFFKKGFYYTGNGIIKLFKTPLLYIEDIVDPRK